MQLKKWTQCSAILHFACDNATISPLKWIQHKELPAVSFFLHDHTDFPITGFCKKNKKLSVYLCHVERKFFTSDAAVSSANKKKLIAVQNYLDYLSLLASEDIIAPENRERHLPRAYLFIR